MMRACHIVLPVVGLLLAMPLEVHAEGEPTAPIEAVPEPVAPVAPVDPVATPTTVAPTEPPDKPADPPAAVPPVTDDIDLSSFGLDPKGGVPFDDKLNIYGFIDANYYVIRFTRPTAYLVNSASFGIGSANVYLAKNLSRRWRSLVELRVVFAPNGNQNADGTITNTTAQDFQNFARPTQWNGVNLERAYLEYDVDPRLTIRVGHWLTPYGIWNIDHGSPTIIAPFRPFIIGEKMFPEHQTGIQVFGATQLGRYRVGYHATVSNGRSPTEINKDLDSRPAFGGRLELEADNLNLGVSYFRGRYTNLAPTTGVTPESYDETAFGADIQWDRGGLHAQGELIMQHRDYRVGHRSMTTGGFVPDGMSLGLYGLVGYRFTHTWQMMPFAFFEHYVPLDKQLLAGVDAINVGLNFRPTPTVVLKIMAARARFKDGGILDGQDMTLITSQAAWVF